MRTIKFPLRNFNYLHLHILQIMKIQILTLAVLFSISLKSFSQTTKSDTIRIHADELNWKPAPAPFPAGAEIVAIEGSAKSPGLFTIRVKFPPNYLLPAHFHPEDERVTVISGSVYIGFGETADTSRGTKFSAGDFYINPKNSHHFVYTKEEGAVLQLNCEGPWGLTFCQ